MIDGKTGLPLAYANIGIVGKNVGTLSDPDGSFELTIPQQFKNDSIIFSSMGFDRNTISVLSLNQKSPTIALSPNSTILDEVIVTGRKTHTNKTRLGWMGGKDGALPFDTIQGGGTIALLVESPKVPSYPDKLQVRLMYNSKDTLSFRLHFYAYDSINQIPGDELLSEEILLKENKRFGWLQFDLSQYKIRLNQKRFFIGFEWIDTRQTRNDMLKGLQDWEKWKKTNSDWATKRLNMKKAMARLKMKKNIISITGI